MSHTILIAPTVAEGKKLQKRHAAELADALVVTPKTPEAAEGHRTFAAFVDPRAEELPGYRTLLTTVRQNLIASGETGQVRYMRPGDTLAWYLV